MQDQLRLYEELILDHNRKPRNFKKLDTPTHQAEGYNPVCGDHFFVYVTLSAPGTIEDIAFDGSGCAISKASASLMTTALKGKSKKEALDLVERFLKLIKGKVNDEEVKGLGKLGIFANIWQYPARVKCAGLSWHTVNGALQEQKTPVTTEKEEG